MRRLLVVPLLLAAGAACAGCAADGAASDAGPGGGGDARAPDARGGSVARNVAYIRATPFPRLVLEVDHAPGLAPRASSSRKLTEGLRDVLAKPGGIEVTLDDTLAARGAGHRWSFRELDALARETFDLDLPADTTAMHILFVDGGYEDDTEQAKVLGLAWAHTHVVIFKQTLESLCDREVVPLLREEACAAAELGVWTHEVGHLLGLVDNGLAMVRPHRDVDHGAHDVNDGCVMYWAYDREASLSIIVDRLLRGEDPDLGFDAECQADIAAVRDAP